MEAPHVTSMACDGGESGQAAPSDPTLLACAVPPRTGPVDEPGAIQGLERVAGEAEEMIRPLRRPI